MSNKQRKFKSSEDTSRDWSYLENFAKKSSARAKFNRENNLTEPVCYNKYSNTVGRVNFKKLYNKA